VRSGYLPAGILAGAANLEELRTQDGEDDISMCVSLVVLEEELRKAQRANERTAEQVKQQAEAAEQADQGAAPAVPDVVMVPPRAKYPWVSVSC
jgi:hypothetical protein